MSDDEGCGCGEYPYTGDCECGQSFGQAGGNCAHFLTEWMIQNGEIEPNPAGCYCCSAGRPIRAKEVRDHVFQGQLDLSPSEDPREDCFIYCERPSDGKGHVYFGTATTCAAGTGAAASLNGFTTVIYFC